MSGCRLCLQEKAKVIKIFEGRGLELHVAAIIAKHFWFEPQEDDPISTQVCTDCWTKTLDFHEFYLRVEKVNSLLDCENSAKRNLNERQRELSSACTSSANVKQEFDKDSLMNEFLKDCEEDNIVYPSLRMMAENVTIIPAELPVELQIEAVNSEENNFAKKLVAKDSSSKQKVEHLFITRKPFNSASDKLCKRSKTKAEKHELPTEEAGIEDKEDCILHPSTWRAPSPSVTSSKKQIERPSPSRSPASHTQSAPSSHDRSASSSPARPAPSSPARSAPSSPNRSTLPSPNRSTQPSPTGSNPHSSNRPTRSSPNRSIPPSPTRSTPSTNQSQASPTLPETPTKATASPQAQPMQTIEKLSTCAKSEPPTLKRLKKSDKRTPYKNTAKKNTKRKSQNEEEPSWKSSKKLEISINCNRKSPRLLTSASSTGLVAEIDGTSSEESPDSYPEYTEKSRKNEVNREYGSSTVTEEMPNNSANAEIRAEETNESVAPDATVQSETTTESFNCDRCNHTFATQSSLKEHIEAIHLLDEYKVSCDMCPGQFASKNSLRLHKSRIHAERHKCDKCPMKYKSIYNLKKHIYLYHNEDPNAAGEIYSCEKCPKKFLTKYTLDVHLTRHNFYLEQKYNCDKCPKSYFLKPKLLEHIAMEHTPEELKTFICPDCPRKFANERLFRKHGQQHKFKNTSNKTFQCKDCPKKFTTPDKYELHIWSVHTPEEAKSFKCDKCTKKFAVQSLLEKHYKLHTNPSMATFACEQCDKKYVYKHMLQDHVWRHHTADEDKSFACEKCSDRFASANMLKQHMKRHDASNKKPVQKRRRKQSETSESGSETSESNNSD